MTIEDMVEIIEGKKLAKEREEVLARQVAAFKKKFGLVPKLLAIMIGENPASKVYLRVKEKAAKRVGILFEEKKFAVNAKPRAIVDFIKTANDDSSVHGIMVQLPLLKKLEIENWKLKILGSIDPRKDVDCLTPENLGLLMIGKPRFLPATVKAIVEIINLALGVRATSLAVVQRPQGTLNKMSNYSSKRKECFKSKVVSPCESTTAASSASTTFQQMEPHKIWQPPHVIRGVQIVIIGAGKVVGLPLAVHLKNLGATVTICDEFTRNLREFTRKAEILISATGVRGLIKKEMVKKGAVVIDVGSPKGDVDFEKVKEVASAITPVPGGVGPLTVVSLLENTLLAAK